MGNQPCRTDGGGDSSAVVGDLSTGDVTNTSTNIAEVGDVHTGDVETTLEAAPSEVTDALLW